MIAKFFSSLPVDEQLNFSVAVTVTSVQVETAHESSQGLELANVCCTVSGCPMLIVQDGFSQVILD